MKVPFRGAFGHIKSALQRITKGSKAFIAGEISKIKAFSKVLAREIVALFVMAIVAGIAFSSLIKSFVFDLLMPFVGLLSPRGDWRNLQIRVGETRFNIGNFLANFLVFVFVALIVLFLLKLLPKKPDLHLAGLARTCPSCGRLLFGETAACEHCGEVLSDSADSE
jgi:large conductance mechanosensitive channel